MKSIQILGTGCPKCKKLFEATQKAVQDAGVEAEVSKVEEIEKILEFGIMATPALVVEGEVKVVGRVPDSKEIEKLIR